MDYKKEYKEALERARGIKRDIENAGCAMHTDMLDVIFPELAESEDERARKDIKKIIQDWWKRLGDVTPGFSTEEEMLAWLEKQKLYPDTTARIPQKPAEWSEEDEKMIDKVAASLVTEIELLQRGGFERAPISTIKKEIEWVKSLRPNHWKPSEEQILNLRYVISGCSYDIEPLVELEEQLKKL